MGTVIPNNNSNLDTNDNVFWFDDPTILYRDGNYKNIQIRKNMSQTSFFNAITRCIILVACILLILFALPGILMLLLIILVTIIIIYYLMQYSMNIEPFKSHHHTSPHVSQAYMNFQNNNQIANPAPIISPATPGLQSEQVISGMNIDGRVVTGRTSADDGYTAIQTNKLINNLYDGSSCSKSYYSDYTNYSNSNNTMNSFYGTGIIPVNDTKNFVKLNEGELINNFSDLQDNINNCDFNASNEFLDKINNGYNNQELNKFHNSLFDSFGNTFEKKNFERQFNTVQNRTNPTNESKARQWIYATPVTCKETSAQCFEYEDLSRKRSPII